MKNEIKYIPNDGLPCLKIGPWALEKYQILKYYCEIFSTGMKNRWDKLIYIDLFSGPGFAEVKDKQKLVESSPMIALKVRAPFSKYFFCDTRENLCVLKKRVDKLGMNDKVKYFPGDCNKSVDEVIKEILSEKGKRVLSFCFVDPFNLNIKFNTIKKLANNGNIDFLILLALPMDAKRNMSHYIKSGNNKLDEFLDNPNWRVEWLQAKKKGEPLMLFLSEQYAVNMANLGYIKLPINKMVPIRSYEKNLPLYYLAFFSRNEKGYIFWKQVLQYSRKQPELPFEIDWSIK